MSDEFSSLFDSGNDILSTSTLQLVTPNIDFQLINQQLLLDIHILKDTQLFANAKYLAD